MTTLAYRYALRKAAVTDGTYREAGARKVRCGCGKKYAHLPACPKCGTAAPAEPQAPLSGCHCGHCGDGPPRCLGRDRGRYELPPEVREQLEKVWAFRQDLVDVEDTFEDAMKALWSSVPAIAACEAVTVAAAAEAAELREQARREHSAGRTSVTSGPLAERLRDAQRRAREARQARRDLIAAAAPGKAAEIAALEQARKDAITACRKRHAAAGLTPWSYLMALSDHGVAVQLVGKRRARNLPARLRHSRHDGTGTIAVQLQRELGVSAAERAQVAGLKAAGLTPWQVSEALAAGVPAAEVTAGQVAALRDAALRPGEVVRALAAGLAADAAAAAIAAGEAGGGTVKAREEARAAALAAALEAAAAWTPERVPGRTWSAQTISRMLPEGPEKTPDPPRSPELLASGGGKWRNVLQLGPWMPPEEFAALPRGQRRDIARTGEAVLAVGGGRTVTLPVDVHRMIPADAEIVEASLTVTRIAGQWDAAVNVTVRAADPPARDAGPAVAVHGGWRKRADGSVRVAAWAAAGPLRVPDALLDAGLVAVHGDGRRGEIMVPAAWVDRAGYPAGVRSVRDTLLDPVREKLAAWLDGHPLDDGPAAGDVRRWQSPGRFAGLALRWRDAPPEGGEEIAALLEQWRVRDRHLWEIEAHDRDQLTRRRDDAWRKVAAWLAGAAGLLVVDDADLAVLRRRPGDADDDPVLPGAAAEKARARAALSAPGRLRQMAVAAAVRRGVRVDVAGSAFLTRTCPECGQVGDADRRYAVSAVVACPHCGHRYDQDVSAAGLMLARAAG